MLTPTIQNTVQDYLNRTGNTGATSTAITTMIQRWINEAKRELERLHNFEYMRSTQLLSGFINSTPTLTASASGGSLATGTYYVVLVAVDANGVELSRSPEQSVAVTGPTGSISVTFSSAPAGTGVSTYRAYYGTATEAQTKYLAGSASPITITDVGSTTQNIAVNFKYPYLTGQYMALPTRIKGIIVCKYRATGPTGSPNYAGLNWQDFNRIGEGEGINLDYFTSTNPDVYSNGYPLGWTTDSINFIIHPQPYRTTGSPPTNVTFAAQMVLWQYSADFTFGGTEEPFLAANAYDCLITWACKLGSEYLGESQDAQMWEQRAMKAYTKFKGQQNIQQLTGSNVILVPDSNAASRRPSIGWDSRRGGRQVI